jgi:MoxR-like ATPase
MPQLRVLLGHQQGQVFALGARPTLIGREPACDIVLPPESPASRKHAEVVSENGEWIVRDLGSRNGTMLNGAVLQCAPLNHDDEIVVGENVFVFEYNDWLTAQTEAAASRAMPSEPLGLQNEPEIQKLVGTIAEKLRRVDCEFERISGAPTPLLRDVFTAIVAGGHCLFIGEGESPIVAALGAASSLLGLRTARIPFTASLSCVDVAGTDVMDRNLTTEEVAAKLIPGPLFSHLVMAENIDRAHPQTMTAICSAMERRALMLKEKEWPMPVPFTVLATVGTNRWQEGALAGSGFHDQVMFTFVTKSQADSRMSVSSFESAFSAADIARLYSLVHDFNVDESLVEYALRVTCATRPGNRNAPLVVNRCVAVGAGPKTAQSLLLGAKARAVLDGRLFATVDDVRSVANAVLKFRLTLNGNAAREQVTEEIVIRKVLEAAKNTSE